MYLPGPQGTNKTMASSMFTRRRLKALFPVLIALLLIPFFVSAFYGGDDQANALLSQARRLYTKTGDSLTGSQAIVKLPSDGAPRIEGNPNAESSNAHIPNHYHGAAERPAQPKSHSHDHSEDSGPESDLLDYGNTDSSDYGLLDYDQINSNYEEGPPGLAYEIPPKKPSLDDFADGNDEAVSFIPDRGDYRELFSLTSKDRRYVSVFFEGAGVTNPSIIPHPMKFDLWIVLAQRVELPGTTTASKQAVCIAGFFDGALICAEAFSNLTMTSYVKGACDGDLAYINDRSGAQDVRMFYGHEAPYVLHSSQSQHTCLGEWLQDARSLLEPFHLHKPLARFFSQATEVQRPPPYKGIEKNYFLFWDTEGKTYVQHELWPKRTFAQIDIDGSVGEDLGLAVAKKDQVCMARYAPNIDIDNESLQQASNSLAITLCDRKDPKCKPSHLNTFVMHMVHHAITYDSHTVYEPYIVLFEQTAPFALHAISQRPFWIHGRQALTVESHSPQYESNPDQIPSGHTERFSIPSISWKNHVQKYHGYMDDVMLLGISIEDGRAGVMDITARDLLEDLTVC